MNGYALFRAAGLSFIIALLALIAMSIGGCTGPKPTVQDADMEMARVSAKTACVQARAEAKTAKYKVLASLKDAKDQIIAMAFDAIAEQADALSPKDPCANGMGFNESRTAIAKSQNETIGAIAPVVASGATVYGVVNSTTRALNTMAGKAGNQTTTTVTGDNNSASHVNTQTTANTQNEVSADGEGASPSVSNGSVTGPDQSSTSETIHEAPAAPVVAE